MTATATERKDPVPAGETTSSALDTPRGLQAVAGVARAQDSLEDKLQKKLKEPFLAKAAWVMEFEKAKAESKKAGKPIFAYFTRSYSP